MLTVDGDSLFWRLREYVKSQDPNNHLFVVHRLDRDTSGLLVFARSRRVLYALQSCFEEGAVERRYEAVVTGGENLPLGKTVRIQLHLLEDRNHNVWVVDDSRGKECVTYAARLADSGKRSYLDISLLTGRRNQIRVSLAHLGCPVVGDKKYGGEKAPRMMLNAYRLAFPDELGLKRSEFEVPRIFDKDFNLKGKLKVGSDR